MEQTKDYPQYPQPNQNIVTKGTYPKMPLSELMGIFDEFTALGMYLVPKRSRAKFPVQRFWEKTDGKFVNILDNRNEAVRWQQNDDVSGWCIVTGEKSGRLLVLDFDTAEIEHHGVDPYALYSTIQRMSTTKFVLKSPANGVHLYYRLRDDQELLGNTKPPINGVDQRCEGGQVVTIGGYNRYDNTATNPYADKKGVQDGHCDTYTKLDGGDYSSIPYMSDQLYSWLTMENKKSPDRDIVEADNYGQTEVGQKRLAAHFLQPLDERERFVIECLSFVLEQWTDDKSYEQWYSMWMAAHHGADGSHAVRDYILSHTNILWRDGQDGKQHFKRAWDTHTFKEGGKTVATLMWLAKKAGWLTRTGYEIPESLMEEISYDYISDWMDTLSEIPKRLLLMSQTGSGKTYALRKLWNNLGQPKTVILVPSIKLATALAEELRNTHEMSVLLYRDNDTGYTLTSEELSTAHVLVTTLQTFSSKVHIPMSEYGLVYIEESDQLLAQFARGGGGLYGSHVSEHEARGGFRVIREAMEDSGVVWFVDATMTNITYSVAEATRSDQTIKVIRNTKTHKKAPVRFVASKGIAYQEILRGLEQGKRVVVGVDTAEAGKNVIEVLDAIGALDGKKHILIVRNTERHPAVNEFMTDVNRYARQYDLVVYNSVMASGVSITDTTPDIFVQICTYLTPRVNLQLLNRYRNQKQVICYYRTGENLYARRAEEILGEAYNKATIESQLVNIPLATRTSDAELRAYCSSLSIGDNEVQERSPREFYQHLLKLDGREIEYAEGTPVSDVVKHTMKGVAEMRKAMRELVASTWHTVRPITRENPAEPHFTDIQVVLGETHAQIERALRGNIPNLSQVSPEEVFSIVESFKSYGFILSAYIMQELALRKAETYLADKGRAITTILNNITLIKIVSTLRFLYNSLDETLTSEVVVERCGTFLHELATLHDKYDAITTRRTQKFAEIVKRNPEPEKRALAFAKILLSRIGLKQRSERASRVGGDASYEYRIVNLEDAKRFLLWRNGEDVLFSPDIQFTTQPIDTIISSRSGAIEAYRNMDELEQDAVMNLLEDTDFSTAINIVLSGLTEVKGVW